MSVPSTLRSPSPSEMELAEIEQQLELELGSLDPELQMQSPPPPPLPSPKLAATPSAAAPSHTLATPSPKRMTVAPAASAAPTSPLSRPSSSTDPTQAGTGRHTPCLKLPGVRLALALLLALLSLCNGVVALPPSRYATGCRSLAWFAVLAGAVALVAIPLLFVWKKLMSAPRSAAAASGGTNADGRADKPPAHSSRRRTLVLLGLLLLGVGVSAGGIQMLHTDTCQSDQSLRQVVLADIIVMLSAVLGCALYWLVRRLAPELRLASRLARQALKASLLSLCLAALLCDLVNLATHDRRGRMTFHYGFSARPHACAIQCPWPESFSAVNQTVRSVQCFDADGRLMDDAMCAELSRPAANATALQPCPAPRCSCAPPPVDDASAAPSSSPSAEELELCDPNFTADGHWAVQYDAQYALDAPLASTCEVRGPDAVQAWLTLGCRSDSRQRWVSSSSCASAALPAGFASGSDKLVLDLPARPCPVSCLPLWSSAVVFAAVLGLASLALLYALLCNCSCRMPRSSRATGSKSSTLASVDHASVPSSDASASSRSPAPGDAHRSHNSFLRLLSLWRHGVLCGALVLLALLSALSLFDLMWLVGMAQVGRTGSPSATAAEFPPPGQPVANNVRQGPDAAAEACRDWTLSAVANAIVTSLLAISACVGVLRNRQALFFATAQRNPFELVGLLHSQEEQAAEEEIELQLDEDEMEQEEFKQEDAVRRRPHSPSGGAESL